MAVMPIRRHIDGFRECGEAGPSAESDEVVPKVWTPVKPG